MAEFPRFTSKDRVRPQRGARRRQGLRCAVESLESRLPLDAQPALLISEIMASNSSTLADGHGEFSDWIEIHNPGAEPIDLAGYYLTDNPTNLNKWQFPSGVIAAGGYQIVFASEAAPVNQELHASFKLSADGEYLAIVAPDATTVVHAIAPAFPQQFSNVSYGLGSTATDAQLIGPGAPARATIPTDGSLGQTWTAPGFVDGGWLAGTSAVGYDPQNEFAATIGLDVTAPMMGVNSSAYVRYPFNLSEAPDFDALSLSVQYGDGFVAYLNGVEVARRNTLADFSTEGRVLSYVATGADVQLSSVTVLRGDETIVYPTSQLIGITLTHFKSDTNVRDITQRFGKPTPTAGNRAGLLDVDSFLTTGVINPGDAPSPLLTDPVIDPLAPENSTPGMAFDFDVPVINGNGPDVILFEIATSGNPSQGDSFHVSPLDGIGAGLNSITIDAFDVQYAAATSVGQLQSYDYSTPPQSINQVQSAAISATTSPSFRALAIGIDLSDLGYAPGAEVSGLFIQGKTNAGGIIDPVFIAGLPPTTIENVDWNSSAASERSDGTVVTPEAIDLTTLKHLLQPGDNVLAIHAMSSSTADDDFLISATLTGSNLDLDPVNFRYFSIPTPGSVNAVSPVDLGPAITELSENIARPGENDNIPITARVFPGAAAINAVSLRYRVMFGAETIVPMFDDGLHGDGLSGDGVYGATIPASASSAGEMVRWRVTANDAVGHESRWPLFLDPVGSPEYFGTVVADPAVNSALPTLEWFVSNTAAADTAGGTRASAYYMGEFFDNIFVRIRGNGARSYPKKSYKFDFNKGYHFRFDPNEPRVSEINLNSTYDDKSYVRQVLAYEAFRESGGAYSTAFPMRIERNGEFYSVATFVEQVDEDYLRRNGLSPNGAMYKVIGRHGLVGDAAPNTPGENIEKKTRENESWSDLNELIDGLALPGVQRENFVFDNVDIPAQVNYMAVQILIQNTSGQLGNYYVYRDTEGTGEWRFLPWDMDVTFGPYSGQSDAMDADNDDSPQHWSHPFVGSFEFPRSILGGDAFSNAMLDAIYTIPDLQAMYLRRLRSLMDQLLKDAAAPTELRYFENRIDELIAQLAPEVLLDKARWGANAHFGSTDLSLVAATNRLKNEYFAPRRTHLYINHNVDSAYAKSVKIPHTQSAAPAITINAAAIEYNPPSGNQDEEYIPLVNPGVDAIDVSNWTLSGGVDFTFKPGTVIPAGGTLYVSPNVNAFRARSTGPSGGQGLFVQGGYSGHISNLGETIELRDSQGELVASVQTPVDPSDVQESLRITELMYHPAPLSAAEINAGFDDADDFEFLELTNTGAAPIDLLNVKFVNGLDFTFAASQILNPGEYLVLARDLGAFTMRYGAIGATTLEYGDNLNDDGSYKLSNGGETIEVEDADGGSAMRFTYDDSAPWHPETDGLGYSLVVVDPATNPDTWSSPSAWRASYRFGGSPGAADQLLGDFNSDGGIGLIDLAILQRHLGGAATAIQGDVNADSQATRADLALFSRFYGARTTPPSASPAPAAIVGETSELSANLRAVRRPRLRDLAVEQWSIEDERFEALRIRSRRRMLRP